MYEPSETVVWAWIRAPWQEDEDRPTKESLNKLRQTARTAADDIRENWLGQGAIPEIRYDIDKAGRMDTALVMGRYPTSDGAVYDEFPHPLNRMEWECEGGSDDC